MNYGLYLSAAGALSSMHQQDVYANNLANVNTVGFKPDMAITRQRLPARLENPALTAVGPQVLLENLGGGHHVQPTHVNLIQGALSVTNNPLDVAIRGDGFFVVESGLLTRDGRFTLDETGTLVMATTGKTVLDENHQPIQLDPSADTRIDTNGEVTQHGRVIARLQVVEPAAPNLLRKVGDSLLRVEGQIALVPAHGSVVQGHVESSAVDPILSMNDMINASKSVAYNATMMQYHDHIMDQAINTFGRVA